MRSILNAIIVALCAALLPGCAPAGGGGGSEPHYFYAETWYYAYQNGVLVASGRVPGIGVQAELRGNPDPGATGIYDFYFTRYTWTSGGDEPNCKNQFTEYYVSENGVEILHCDYYNYSSAYAVDTRGNLIYTGGADKLQSGENLYVNQAKTSADGRFRLQYQGDGNLVLLNTSTNPWVALWASNTAGICADHTVMQGDGNLVVYDCNGTPWWASNTNGNNGAWSVVASDGDFGVYSADGWQLWHTNTGGH